MNATFYVNNSPKDNVDKALTLVANAEIKLLRGTSMVNPVITFQGSLPTFNYVYLSDFDRYYYVEDITNVLDNMWSIAMHVDVLMSHKVALRNNTGLIGRQEFVYEPYLRDNMVPKTNDTKQYIKKFTNGIEFTNANKVVFVNPYANYLASQST